MSAAAASTPRRQIGDNTRAEGQIAKANELLNEIADVNHEYSVEIWSELKTRWAAGTCTFAFVSAQIGSMIDAKKGARHLQSVPNLPQIPDGRYAVTGTDGSTDFYRVARDKAGKYRLFLYVSDKQQLIGNWKFVVTILNRIERDGVQVAATRWGLEMVRCHRCGAKLTDQNNPYRAQGLGPDCGTK